MTTALFTHPASLDHVTPQGHPEQVARIEAIEAVLAASEFAALDRRLAPLGELETIRKGHSKVYYDRIKAAMPEYGDAHLDPDTFMSPGTWQAALRAVGGAVAAVDAVMTGQVTNAFVATRPPGHHAEKARAMGFCFFSNVAIAAIHAANEYDLGRVAVIDFDVHHGNGTQDVLWHESRVKFASSQQMPFYPYTGGIHQKGAFGQIINVPLEEATGGEVMRAAYEDKVFPILRDYDPDLVLVSAGFDAHIRDPLAGLQWETEDFAWLATRICDLAHECCDGRVVSCLEGGYDLTALGESVGAYVRVMMERGA